MDPFAKTRVKLNETLNLLLCTKCLKLPEESVWMLSSCKHKYCKACFGDLEVNLGKAKKCVACNQFSPNQREPAPDLFSTKLLAELKTFKKYLGVCSVETEDPVKDAANPSETAADVKDDESCKLNAKDSTTCDNKDKTEKDVHMDLDLEEEETERIIRSAFQPPSVTPPAATSGDNENESNVVVTTNKELNEIEPATDEFGEDSDKEEEEPKTSLPPRKFFRRERAENPKPQQPQVNISFSVPKETKKALPIPKELKKPLPPAKESKKALPAAKESKKPLPAAKEPKKALPAATEPKKALPAAKESKKPLPAPKKALPAPKEPKEALPVPVSKTRKGIKPKAKEQVPATPKTPLRSSKRGASVTSSTTTISKCPPSSTTTTPIAASPASVKRKNAKGETTLHIAAKTGHVDKVKKLLEMASDINVQDNAGWTPLHEAVNGNSAYAVQVAEILLNSGCRVNVTGGAGVTALHEAAQMGNIDMVKLLLSYSASKDIQNERGLLAAEVASTAAIADLIAKFDGPYRRKLASTDVVVKESGTLIYFVCPVKGDVLKKLGDSFKLKVSEVLSSDVTHVIFDSKPKSLVPLTIDYLRGILTGAWLVSLEWLTESLSRKNFLDPDRFEIGGYLKPPRNPSDLPDASTEFPGGSIEAQKRARLSREKKEPGLFHGLSFYIYKNSAYHHASLKVNKKDLAITMRLGDGEVGIREPNPDMVDPLDNPIRFHIRNSGKHKLSFTTHLILFGDGNVPPPAKLFNLEHVKTLRVDWFIQSVLNFGLCDPTPFLPELIVQDQFP